MVELIEETAQTKSIALAMKGRSGLASAPEDADLVLTVERLDDGEVSPYLVDELRPATSSSYEAPIGGYFVWEARLGGPLLLVAGGSGIAPFRAILRHHRAIGNPTPVRLLYSARTLGDVIFREELMMMRTDGVTDVRFTLTRERPEGWNGYTGRINAHLLADVAWSPSESPLVYVCGPTAFVETAASTLVALGHDPARIRTERFGPTGG